MKILVITKRQYTGHDLIDDRFGRLREVPLALARRGHEVRGLCLSYARRSEQLTVDTDDASGAEVKWESMNAGTLKLPGLLRYRRRAKELVAQFQPDIVWACSDSLFGILGNSLAKIFQTRCVFDIYDNFESFGTVSLPGVRRLYRRAVRDVAGVTCASAQLQELLRESCARTGPVLVLENAIRPDIFFPRKQKNCREEFGLPLDATVIGVAGALSRSRGIEAVFAGFRKLQSENDRFHLVLAGPRDAGLALPGGPNVRDLGMLPLARVPALISAMDVAVIANKDSAFGRYCFPQKLNEIMACEVPFVAADVGAMQFLLRDHPQFLFAPEDADDFARAARLQSEQRFLLERPVPTWDAQAALIDDFFHAVDGADFTQR